MVGWHHRLNGHEFQLASGDSEGQEYLACCSPWGDKELDTTERLNNNNESSEREIKETIPFPITSERIQYLGINLHKLL